MVEPGLMSRRPLLKLTHTLNAQTEDHAIALQENVHVLQDLLELPVKEQNVQMIVQAMESALV